LFHEPGRELFGNTLINLQGILLLLTVNGSPEPFKDKGENTYLSSGFMDRRLFGKNLP
jgi:hypothetical protein